MNPKYSIVYTVHKYKKYAMFGFLETRISVAANSILHIWT